MAEGKCSAVGQASVLSQYSANKADVGLFGALLEDSWLFSLVFVSCVLVVFWKMVQLFDH